MREVLEGGVEGDEGGVAVVEAVMSEKGRAGLEELADKGECVGKGPSGEVVFAGGGFGAFAEGLCVGGGGGVAVGVEGGGGGIVNLL